MGHPSIYVFDCSNAGLVAESFKAYAKQIEQEQQDVSHFVTSLCNIEELLRVNVHNLT
jgi:hypothetical protein